MQSIFLTILMRHYAFWSWKLWTKMIPISVCRIRIQTFLPYLSKHQRHYTFYTWKKKKKQVHRMLHFKMDDIVTKSIGTYLQRLHSWETVFFKIAFSFPVPIYDLTERRSCFPTWNHFGWCQVFSCATEARLRPAENRELRLMSLKTSQLWWLKSLKLTAIGGSEHFKFTFKAEL